MRKFLKSRDDAMYFCESVEVDSFFLAFLWKFRYNVSFIFYLQKKCVSLPSEMIITTNL